MNNKISKTEPSQSESPAESSTKNKPALKNQEAFSGASEEYDDQTTLNQSAMQEGSRQDLPKGHPHAA